MAKQHIARHDKATSSARGNVVPFPLSRYAAKVRAVASQHGRALLVEGSTTEKCNALILWREINNPDDYPLSRKQAAWLDALVVKIKQKVLGQ